VIDAPPLLTVERDAFVFRPHAGQFAAWNATQRVVALIAGTGGGKTSFGAAWMLREAVERVPGGEFIALAPTYPMLNRVIIPRLLAALGPIGGALSKADGWITLPNGSRVYLISADAPERAEGIHGHAVWLDEAGDMSPLMWEVARRRVGLHRGRILITTTPYNMGWLKSEVHDRWAAGDPEYFVSTFASIANPAYPREEFERARRDMSESRFAMFYLGEFRRASGLVYPDWAPARMLCEPFDVPAAWRRVIGLDLGWHNATAAVLLAESPDGVVYVTNEHYAAETLLAEHAAALKAWGAFRAFADPSGRQHIEELRRAGVWIAAANNDVLAGIDAVTKLIRSERLRVFRGRAPHLVAELEGYVWEQRDGQQLDRPRKQDDHAVDALRYGCMALVTSPRARVVPRPKGW